MAECLHCGGDFVARKVGHVFCSIGCRHRGERRPVERVPVDHEAVARLFAEDRDPGERVMPDDWHPTPDSPVFELDLVSSVGQRRYWYRNLERMRR